LRQLVRLLVVISQHSTAYNYTAFAVPASSAPVKECLATFSLILCQTEFHWSVSFSVVDLFCVEVVHSAPNIWWTCDSDNEYKQAKM